MKKARRYIRFLNVFGIFNRHQIVHAMPFILFLTVLVLFYIGNSYYAERTIREIDKIKNDMKEKRAEFISTKSDLMFHSKQSEVAKAIQTMQIKEATEPSRKLLVEGSKNNKQRE